MKRNKDDYKKDLLYYAEEVSRTTDKYRLNFLLQCIDGVITKIKELEK